MQGHLPKFQCETISWSNWTMQNYTWRFSTEWSLSSNGINRHLKGQRVTFRRVPKAAQRHCSKFRQEAGSNPCNWVIYTCQMKNHVIWWNIFSFHGVCPLLDTIHSNHALDMYNGFSPIHLRGSVFTFCSSFFLSSLCTGILLEVLHCSTIFDQQMCEGCDRVASNPCSHLINLNFFQTNMNDRICRMKKRYYNLYENASNKIPQSLS